MKSQVGSKADSFSDKLQHGPLTATTIENTPTWTQRATRILFHVSCLAWLVPILYMLIRNFQTWIIGASAWCPDDRCFADLFDTIISHPLGRAQRFNSQSHDLVGALQFAAKALEVWFIIIATSFVYLYTMFLAGRAEGLPIRYLTWPEEFSVIPAVFSRSLWSTAFSRQYKEGGMGTRLRLFLISTVFLCILCNLMGPAVAVLIIPSLQWVPTPSIGNEVFNEVTSASAPNAEALLSTIQSQYNREFARSCTLPELAAGNYSCTTDTRGLSLDALVANYIDSYDFSSNSSNFGLVQEELISSLLFNASDQKVFAGSSLWVPNRQLLKQLGYDSIIIAATSLHQSKKEVAEFSSNYESYGIFNRSLQMKIERNGPVIGARPNYWGRDSNGPAWTTYVDSSRKIRCYQGYKINTFDHQDPEFTRCIRLGTGWNTTNKQVNFSISGYREHLSGKLFPGVNITASFSDKATFFEGSKIPTWLPSGCLSNGANGGVPSDISCDWDRFFSLEVAEYANRTRDVSTWDFFRPNDTITPFASVDFVANIGFALYQLDLSPATNPLLLAQTLNVPSTGPSFAIDPHWAALAWSADVSGIVPANHTAPHLFVYGWVENPPVAALVAELTVLHMLTMLPYSTLPRSATKVDSEHPLLQRNGTVYVYAYRVNSRTSKLSVVVVLIGVVVVVMHAVLGLLHWRPYRSLAEVVVATLEHTPQGEFSHANTSKEAVKTRFRVEHTDQGVGELVFRKQY